ncbi:MAG: hypothetical protein EDM05_055340 [Leptolyngbya sp. IPPAS B-1204]
MRLEAEVIEYFKNLAIETGISYQSLINLYLQDCVKAQRKPARTLVLFSTSSASSPEPLHRNQRHDCNHLFRKHADLSQLGWRTRG